MGFLNKVDKAWQPTDFLPDMASEGWLDSLHAMRKSAEGISDDLLVVLVGDMVTEEALPSYSVSLNAIAENFEGNDQRPWARWLRGWTAEENRHGDLLNTYLRLTGRVDMRAVELTVHYLLTNGFNPGTHPNPYNGLIYTSFQERATKVSHGNVAKLAQQQGDPLLASICQKIAAEESRHETFYTRMMGRVLDIDPEGGILCIRGMFRSLISMPGKLMYDGKDPDLFDHFAVVAQRNGVYTVHDYATILDHLVRTWDIPGRSVSGKAAKAQDYICRQADRYRGLADQVAAMIDRQPRFPFSWVHGRSV